MSNARGTFESRSNKFITKLTNNVIHTLRRNTNNMSDISEIIRTTHAVFDSVEFRTKFIEDVEIRKAKNLGEAIAQKILGKQQVVSVAADTSCDKCIRFNNRITDLGLLVIDDLPPHHAGCACTMQFDPGIDSVKINDNTVGLGGTKTTTMEEPVPGDIAEGELVACPKCGKTAVRTKNTTDIYSCKACSYSFQKVSTATESETS